MDNGEIEEIKFDGEFRLCYDERDFTPGTKLHTSVANYMLMSKKVILILSHDYLASNRHRE